MPEKAASILASETRILKSTYTSRNYRITIGLPYTYRRPNVKDWPFTYSLSKWPVVYLLDANWYFGMVTEMIRPMAWYGRTTDAIVVGIGYAEDEDPQEAWREIVFQRANDFTPARDKKYEKGNSDLTKRKTRTGDAGRFHQLIKNELIPLIEREYEADSSKRILTGHSLGGLFGTFALLQEPELFHRYIIASPSLTFADKFLFEFEESYFKKHKSLNAKVYLSAGELEESSDDTTLTTMLRFAATLESRNYEGLTMVRRIFANLNHCEVIAPCFQAGLMWALKI